MVAGFTEALHECGVIPVLKHFPGHGAVSGNTHSGSGISVKTLEDWRKTDFVPFAAGIRAEAEMVMISHQTAVAVDPDSPASLSPAVIGLLRQELGFEGVIITDALRMKAVHEPYGSWEACVRALEAGADMLLLPYNFTAAYESVLKAVQEGRLSEDRIDESLLRILNLKERYGLLPFSR
jgi:beta-N-acetylhexosaminidase